MYVYFSLNNMVFFSVFILQYIAHTKMHHDLEEESTPRGLRRRRSMVQERNGYGAEANVDPCRYPCEVGGHVLSWSMYW